MKCTFPRSRIKKIVRTHTPDVKVQKKVDLLVSVHVFCAVLWTNRSESSLLPSRCRVVTAVTDTGALVSVSLNVVLGIGLLASRCVPLSKCTGRFVPLPWSVCTAP